MQRALGVQTTLYCKHTVAHFKKWHGSLEITYYIKKDGHNNNNERFILRRVLHIGKHMTSILRHVAEAFPLARQGTILNSHRVIRNATNTSMVLNCALGAYRLMTADVGLPEAV